ncbi:MAG: glycosyltransferase family 39 protein [Thauera sp.]|nr:glycosyltransferase family 39 protein [Thauera sp.]
MITDPRPTSLLQRRIYGTLGITLLVGLYLLVGLTGHDPWRGDDARHFGPVWSMLRGEGLLFPQLAGEPFAAYPPLYYWFAALTALATSPVLAPHDGARIATALFTAATVYCTARAAESLYGRPARTPAAMLTLGTLGLVLHAHETQPMIAVVAMLALTLYGLAKVPQQPAKGSITAGIGAALAFLAGGVPAALLTMPLLPLALTLSRDCRTPHASGGLLLGLSIALGLGALWPVAIHLLQPEAYALWLKTTWRELASGPIAARDLNKLVELLGWFTWPLWPIALWALWRGRRQLGALPLLLPLLSAVLTLAWVSLTGELSPSSMLPLLPPLALLAAGGVPTLRRGAANAFDWFGVMTFAVFGLLIWLAWTAQAYSWPPGLARHANRVAPDFVLHGSAMQLSIGVLITVFWLLLVWRLPRNSSRSPSNWALGMTMLWCLAVTLLMPWFDHGRSYRPVMKSLEGAVAGEVVDCIATTGLPDALRSSLDYFAGIRTVPVQDDSTPCSLLLVHDNRRIDTTELAPEWRVIWDYRRGGGKQLETFRLYRRTPG